MSVVCVLAPFLSPDDAQLAALVNYFIGWCACPDSHYLIKISIFSLTGQLSASAKSTKGKPFIQSLTGIAFDSALPAVDISSIHVV
jgi:hypothetical protein